MLIVGRWSAADALTIAALVIVLLALGRWRGEEA